MVDIDNTIADYTNGLRDYIRECGRGEDECPCPEPAAYDFTLTVGWPFSGDAKAFTWWHTRAVADGLYSKEEPYEGAVDALNQLHDAGWNIIMATSRADDWRGESQRWLHRNGFQFDGYYNGDKTLLTPDVLIDDRPDTLEAMTAKGVTVLHPDHAYCAAVPEPDAAPWLPDWAVETLAELDGQDATAGGEATSRSRAPTGPSTGSYT